MPIYNAELSRGSLLPLESKRIATLLLTGPDDKAWAHAIEIENILQKNTVFTANRQANLIRKRLMTLDATGWNLIIKADSEVTNQLLFAAAIMQSKLLGDFMFSVYANRQRKLEMSIAPSNWEDFLTDCSHLDPTVANWNDSTKLKIYRCIKRILVEAKYIVDRDSMSISPRALHPVVKKYLLDRDEAYVIDCLERVK
jgi:hypothetical protein